jgi:hypothetical protein
MKISYELNRYGEEALADEMKPFEELEAWLVKAKAEVEALQKKHGITERDACRFSSEHEIYELFKDVSNGLEDAIANTKFVASGKSESVTENLLEEREYRNYYLD